MPINDQLASRLTQQLADVSAGDLFQQRVDQGLIDFGQTQPGSGSNGNAVANARASRAAALKQLTIQRKKLEFQKTTGLRDIGQARTEGLRGAINNALQRGIFRSGIRVENESKVNREADEAKGDLTTNIQFALDDLAARREGIEAQKFSTGGGGSGGLQPPISIEQGRINAVIEAGDQRDQIIADSPFAPSKANAGIEQRPQPQSSFVPSHQPGGPR